MTSSLQTICPLPTANPVFPCLLVVYILFSPYEDQGSYVCSLSHIPSGQHQGLHSRSLTKIYQIHESE